MKKIFLLLTLMLFSSMAFSQAGLGVKAGGMMVTKTGNTLDHNLKIVKASYLGGMFYGIPFNERFGLQLELLYANKGRGEARQFLIREDLHYLNLPIMLQYTVTKRWGIELGPEIGYLLGQRQFFTFGTQPPSPFQKNFDMAINLGMNYALTKRLFLNLRYNLGIYDTSKPFHEVIISAEPEEDTFTGNRTLQLSLGYWLSQ
ncbi:MAG: porin family protein [Bacteroidota bacterium]